MTDIWLAPDKIKAVWAAEEQGHITIDDAMAHEKNFLGNYEAIWKEALMLPGFTDLYESLVQEISNYNGMKPAEVKIYFDHATEALARLWESGPYTPPEAIHKFYESPHYIFELMAWHSLREDNTPLAYVMALEFAQQIKCHAHLDFGSGVGSGTILFDRYGIYSHFCDVSQTLLKFSHWRMTDVRKKPSSSVNLRIENVPRCMFNLITAMEVFEHLAYPLETLEHLYNALTPGGYLFIQLSSCKPDPLRPQHIVTDPTPIYAKLDQLGMAKVWGDTWCWGHEIFQKGEGK